jgi:hypothetical protein
MNNYFPFTSTGNFEGEYSAVQSTNGVIETIGNTCDPNDILKLNAGSNAWSQIVESITYTNINLTIESLSSSDWTTNMKEEWFNAYLLHIGLNSKITPSQYTELFNHAESLNIFEHLSAPSIAYVNRNDGTNAYNDDFFYTNEVFLGLNTYKNNFIREYADSLSPSPLRDVIYTNHKSGDIYISNTAKVTYNGYTDIVYAFEGIEYSLYNIDNIDLEPSLTNGGGNMFAEVKLAGDALQAHYKVRKDVDPKDPTFGYCSGVGKEQGYGFCMGDEIVIVDTTVWSSSSTSGTSGNSWTWLGDFTVLPYEWHVADVSYPCTYYRNVTIFDQLFPLRIIQFCIFDDFN